MDIEIILPVCRSSGHPFACMNIYLLLTSLVFGYGLLTALKIRLLLSATQERQLVDKVRFGETVHQPLKVHLKRKHWDEAAAQKAEHERCKRVFLSQMNMAQQQQQQAGGKGDGRPAAAKVRQWCFNVLVCESYVAEPIGMRNDALGLCLTCMHAACMVVIVW